MADRKPGRIRLIHALLVPPYIALMWVPFYDVAAPALWGIPFFYWYQILWVPLGVLLLYPLYRAEG